MPTLSSADLRPAPPRPRGGLSARFYIVALIAAVLMIVLQAIPLLHGRGSANADATQTPENPPAAPAAVQPASQQPTSEQPTPKTAQPAAPVQPQVKVATPAPTESPAADTPITATNPLTAAKPATTPPPAPPGDSAAAVAAPSEKAESTPASFGVTVAISPDETAPPLSTEERSSAENALASATSNATLEFFSNARPANLTPPKPTNHESEQIKPAQAQPDVWRGVLRLISAVTKIDFTAPSAASEATSPIADAAAPVAIPEDVDESTAESSPSDVEPTPLSSTETLPAATQPVSPVDDETRLVIENPLESGGVIRFLVDGNVASLRAGESLTLREGPTRIQFHRGDDFENVDVELSFGAYQFRPTKTGWTLSR